jgi:hypothetical protein
MLESGLPKIYDIFVAPLRIRKRDKRTGKRKKGRGRRGRPG